MDERTKDMRIEVTVQGACLLLLALALALALALTAVAGCARTGQPGRSSVHAGNKTEPTAGALPSTAAPSSAPKRRSTLLWRVYFVKDEKLYALGRRADEPHAVALGAVRDLLQAPTPAETAAGYTSAVPQGTQVRSVVIDDEGVAIVDLSSGFGSGGGSLSMQTRVAQVVFTLTQLSTVKSVSFKVDGRPVDALGGEGLVLDEPQTRSDWERFAPAILVESPLPEQTVSSPLTILGTANVFEARFRAQILDDKGNRLAESPVTATSGTGTRGTFEQTLTFDMKGAKSGKLRVFETSPKDGSPTNIVEIPLKFE